MELHQPVPELPVADVEAAQRYYRDALGFEIGWLTPGKELGAVSRGPVEMFLRRKARPFEPTVHWIHVDDADAAYENLRASGAHLVDGVADKPWGLRQFTVEDVDGNGFYIHHDLPFDEQA